MLTLSSNQTGALSYSSTVLITLLLILCYTLDSWDVISYNSQDVKKSIEDAGLNISLHDGYSIITLNSTVTVKDDQVSKKIMLVEMVEGGMWKTCYVTNEEMESTVKADDELFWATDVCTLYKPVGQANFPHASGRYLRHMMTRTAQSCMIVSCICILATLSLGAISLIIKHVILSMIATTVCAAAVLYQLLLMALMMKRTDEAKVHLRIDDIPVSLEDSMQVKFGYSTYLSVMALLAAIVSSVFWAIHFKTLRGAIKLNIPETKYTLFCRT